MSCLSILAVGLHLASVHSVPSYNNNNPGVYVQTECLTIGAYYNSERSFSVHAGYTYDVPKTPFFVAAGLATGYRAAPIIPMAMVGLRADAGPYRLRLGYIPKLHKMNDTHVFHLMVERRF